MTFTLVDLSGFAVAVVAAAVVVTLPGYALTRLFAVPVGRGTGGLLTAVLVGLAALPAIDSVLVRLFTLDVALAATLALAATGAAIAWHERSREAWSTAALVLAALWLILLAVEWIDYDVGGRLYQPLTIFDMVKHAATTQAIVDSGAPPRDAFFLRPERSSYYYFFYTLSALVMKLCGGLVDAKAAVGGVAFWTGLGAYGAVRLGLERCGLAPQLAPSRFALLLVAVLAAGGLDLLGVFGFAALRHYWIADPLHWNEQVGAWLEDVIWVPHHIAAMIAGTIALAALCEASGQVGAPQPRPARPPRLVVLAGLAFASAFGLSIWVTLALVVTVAAWLAALAAERRWRTVALVLAAGAVALLVALPQLHDLRAGRAPGDPVPIALTIRAFTPTDLLLPEGVWSALGRVVALPLNYLMGFGLLVPGTLLFWRLRRSGALPSTEFLRVLTIATCVGLVLGTVLRSTLFNNDLGWRVMLLPLLGGTVWTVAVLDRALAARVAGQPLGRPAIVASFAALFAIGWATVLYGAVMMRTYPFVTLNASARFIAADPATERGLREAFGWVDTHLPETAVLQQNPMKDRAFAFGVYGRNPVGVGDVFASLYGAAPEAVEARMSRLGPIFEADLPPADAMARAASEKIAYLVLTAADPAWAHRDSVVWTRKPVYAADRVRIIPVDRAEANR